MRALLPIAAGIGIEGIIWLIILIFWGIAQLVQRSRTSQRGPGQPRRPASPMESELQEILEQLSGQKPVEEEEEEAEVEFEAPKPAPVVRRPPPPPPTTRRRPPVEVRRPAAAPLSRAFEAIPEMAEMRADIAPLSADMSAAVSAFFAQGMNARTMSLKSQYVHLRGMAFHVPVGLARHGEPVLSLDELRAPRTFSRIMLASMVLNPPKALERPGGSLAGI